jgi:hypothetical protein
MNFGDYQSKASETDQFKGASEKIIHHLLNLTETVGNLSRSIEQEFRDDKGAEPYRSNMLSRKLGDILWYTSVIASRNQLNLQAIAENNLTITRERWAKSNAMQGKAFDEDCPKFERLPERMSIAFFNPQDAETLGRVLMCVRLEDGEWVQLGDRIDDNAPAEDGYRFHDVFHFGYVAHLGWSPVIRALLKRKRKSRATADRVEDGARATNIEEALTAYIFRYASEVNFFENQKSVDFNILKTVVRIAGDLEVTARTYGEWEIAILEGYRVFRELRTQGEGILKLDCRQKSAAKKMLLEPLSDAVRSEIGLVAKQSL